MVLCDNLVYLFQTSPRSYIWLVIGCPILLVVHGVVSAISWFFVITIPLAKVCTAPAKKSTVTPVLGGHSKIDKTKVLKTNDSLMYSAILLTCIKR